MGGYPSLLLSTRETASGVYSVQPQCKTGIGGRKKWDPELIKGQEPLSYKERLRAGTVQPGREKTQ